jgi:hypothetical protein
MLFWNIFLYTAGALLALRSLISLMAQHKQVHERKLRNQAAREASPATESGQEGSETRSPRAAQAKPSAA